MQKTSAYANDCPQRDRTESEWYGGSADFHVLLRQVNHGKLIEILSRTIKDGRVVSLIHKYLRSGVIAKGLWHASEEGTLQGSPLSSLLSNIILNELDKEHSHVEVTPLFAMPMMR